MVKNLLDHFKFLVELITSFVFINFMTIRLVRFKEFGILTCAVSGNRYNKKKLTAYDEWCYPICIGMLRRLVRIGCTTR